MGGTNGDAGTTFEGCKEGRGQACPYPISYFIQPIARNEGAILLLLRHGKLILVVYMLCLCLHKTEYLFFFF